MGDWSSDIGGVVTIAAGAIFALGLVLGFGLAWWIWG